MSFIYLVKIQKYIQLFLGYIADGMACLIVDYEQVIGLNSTHIKHLYLSVYLSHY
jgi:hypothetical protein